MVACVVDCGSSKIRCTAIRDGVSVACCTVHTGASDAAAAGRADVLRMAVREAIILTLEKAGLTEKDLEWTVTFGLSTSELGLMEVPHQVTPVDRWDLARNTRTARFEEIAPGNFYLIPGVRNRVKPQEKDALEETDSMRGEETQIVGALDTVVKSTPCDFLFLGSHTKWIQVDAQGRITHGVTTLSGQAFRALREHTIIATALPDPEVVETEDDTHFEAVRCGYRLEQKHGFLRAVLMVRCLYNLASTSPLDRLAFLEGVFAASDMECIQHYFSEGPPRPVVIFGQPRRARIYENVLKQQFGTRVSEVVVLSSEEANDITVAGALSIMDCKRRIDHTEENSAAAESRGGCPSVRKQ